MVIPSSMGRFLDLVDPCGLCRGMHNKYQEGIVQTTCVTYFFAHVGTDIKSDPWFWRDEQGKVTRMKCVPTDPPVAVCFATCGLGLITFSFLPQVYSYS